MTNNTSRFVNLWQTAEERKEKYHLCKSLGVNFAWAMVMRDWRLSKIEQLFHLYFPKTYRNAPIMAPYAQFLLPGFQPDRPKVSNADFGALQSNSDGLAP